MSVDDDECSDCTAEKRVSRRRFWATVEGQVISLAVCGTGLFSTFLATPSYSFNAPTFQSLANYIFLAVVYSPVLLYRRRPLTHKWYMYFVLALVDVEANSLVVRAYHYTSITSVQLLDCCAIPFSMLVSLVALKAKYGWRQVAAVVLCVVGLVCTVLSDVFRDPSKAQVSGTMAWVGDIMCIGGSGLYAVSNVLQEYMVKTLDVYHAAGDVKETKGCLTPWCRQAEVLAMLGVFGSFVSGIHVAVFERDAVAAVNWDPWEVGCSMFGFVMCLSLMYSMTSHFLSVHDAAAFNLSLLTADIYAVAFVWIYKGDFRLTDWIYFLAFFLTIGGLLWYHTSPPPTSSSAIVTSKTNADLQGPRVLRSPCTRGES